MTFATFISYTGADEAAATRCFDALTKVGISAYFAPADVRTGPFLPQLDAALRDTRSLTLIVSPRVSHQSFVWTEVRQALKQGTPIIPIVISRERPQMWLAQVIRRLNQVRALDGLADSHLAELVAKVRDVSRAGRVIAVLNMKGGVGKTMLSAHAFPAKHLRDRTSTLLVDLDPQHNLTQFFVSRSRREEFYGDGKGVTKMFSTAPPVAERTLAIDGAIANLLDLTAPAAGQRIDLTVGTDEIITYCLDLVDQHERTQAKTNFIANINEARGRYASIIVDLNPSASFLTLCALDVADHIVVPVRPEKYAMTGLNLLKRLLERLGKAPRPALFSTVLNGVGDRTVRARDERIDEHVRTEILRSDTFASTLIPTHIPHSAVLRATDLRGASATPLSVIAERAPRVARSFRDSLYTVAASIYRRAGVYDATEDPGSDFDT